MNRLVLSDIQPELGIRYTCKADGWQFDHVPDH